MIRKALMILIPAILTASTALAGTQTLELKNGLKYTGEVTKTNNGYQITLPGGSTVEYAKDKVKAVTGATDPAAEYKAKLDKIDASKPDGHFDIGKWAQTNNYVDIAFKEYSEAYKLDPNSERIKTRLQQVTDLIDELTKAGAKSEGGETTTKVAEPPVAGQTAMSDQDMYRIRMYELASDELKSSPPAIEWKGKVPDEFIKLMREQGNEKFTVDRARDDFMAMSKPQQLLMMRKNLQDGDKLFDSVLIKSDPRFMRDFRQKVWPTIRTTCASVDCHGSAKGKGGLQLLNGKSERTDYQNFLILSRWSSGGRPLVDRREPGDSLLLQCGLPQKLAKQGFQHPNVPQRQSPFAGTRDPSYRAIEGWIKALKGPGMPDYRTEWKPAVGSENMIGESGGWLKETPASGPAGKPDEGKAPTKADPFDNK